MTRPNYVGAYYDWDTDAVIVWERDEAGRKPVAHHAPYYFYAPDENGTYTSIFGDKLKKHVFDSKDEFTQASRAHSRKFESDIPPMFKVLMNEYYDLPTPDVHYAFLDIEVDYQSKLGFSSPQNPYAPINAVTIYQSWTKRYLTFAVPPKGWDPAGFEKKIDDLWAEHKLGFKPEVTIFKNEYELLVRMVEEIQNADIISGWNSEFFDLPYIIKRLEQVAGKRQVQLMCFAGCKPPREGFVERFGNPNLVYSLSGRTHLDYLDLFKKFTFEGRTSYSLANIAADELDIPKLHYDGTLEELYNNDFAHFVAYNARDVEVLVKLDDKFKFIALVNQMAHENTCLFQNMTGTVRYVETGITNRAHNVHNLIVADKKMMNDGVPVEGALVLSPLVGLHEWLGSVDINSLYPSVMRALNISPEKFVGHFVKGEDAWRGIHDMDDNLYIMLKDSGEEIQHTGDEWWKILVDNRWVITAYGSVFDQSTGLGIVPEAIQFWYNERKRLQAKKKEYQVLLKAEKDEAKKKDLKRLVEHYDLLQLTKKIQLNSTYGALLSPHFRFGRKEMGASVTGCGRHITSFMISNIGELVDDRKCNLIKVQWGVGKDNIQRIWCNSRPIGQEERLSIMRAADKTVVQGVKVDDGVSYTYETDSPSILLSDTDSCYFKTGAEDKDTAIEAADFIAEEVNSRFPEFMRKNFNCQPGDGSKDLPDYFSLIKAGREIVGSRGIFLNAKKKYTIKVVNLDGFDLDPPKLKTVGSEMKKADTPKVIQDFLKEMMNIILDGGSYKDVEVFVNQQRGVLITKVKDPIALGVSKQINNLDNKYREYLTTEKVGKGKVTLPGHVRAAVNYNELVMKFEPGIAQQLKSGDKGIIFYLKPNDFGIKSIALPADMDRFPEWFNEHLKLDKKLTEEKMIDSKLERVFEALGWDIPTPQKSMIKSVLKF